jgi:ATP-dependent helicase/DNAse subunit B
MANNDKKDKYSAVWVSHSSISDFLKCPRAYYLRNVYKDPKRGRRITLMKPPLALGQVIHDVVDQLSNLPSEDRLKVSLQKRFETIWEGIAGKKGGFVNKNEEGKYKERGVEMLKRLEKYPGPILAKAIKINQDLPHYWFSEDENIILCGKIDWMEYLEDEDGVRIIDFKTGKTQEDKESLQLPIYYLLASNTQKRDVKGVSYWYLSFDNKPRQMKLPKEKNAYEKILKVAKRIKLARQINHFKCPVGGCTVCIPLEEIAKGKGERVGVSDFNQDVYVLL